MPFDFFIRSRDLDLPDSSTNTVGPHSKLAGTDFDTLQLQCKRNGRLFTDPDFPANETSLGMPDKRGRYKWMRPKDMTSNAHFMSDGVSRFDVKQGELGDCWMAAALVALCQNQSLFEQVVPVQSMDEDYAGIFKFNFWQYGKWVPVIVDDQLPTIYGEPAFISSTDNTEFWSALLEKAYAKLHGSYGALEGGHAVEAMEDFTGGVCEWMDLKRKAPDDLYTIMVKALDRHSLLSCAIDAKSSYDMEAELTNGLIKGHAYTVNWLKELTLKTGRRVQLIRLRNPWGNDKEWQLAWSDKSTEWYNVADWDKQEIQYAKSADGEFWMSYDDFVDNFDKLEICNLGPDALTEDLAIRSNKRWEMIQHDGEWVRNVSAGGCMNNWKTSFCSNPQFHIEVTAPDDDDDKGTVLVALMQKQLRSIKKTSSKNVPIGYSIFKMDDSDQKPIDSNYIRRHGSPEFGSDFTNLREVSNRHKVAPGHYCIIPSTFEPYTEREFILRVYSEKKYAFTELDEATRNIMEFMDAEEEDVEEEETYEDVVSEDEEDSYSTPYNDEMGSAMSRLNSLLANKDDDDEMEISSQSEAISILAESLRRKTDTDDKREKKKVIAAFGEISDHGLEIDAYRLQEIIETAYSYDFDFTRFDIDVCRSMVAMLDNDRSGKLNFKEAKKLWKSLRKWSTMFKENDIDEHGSVRSYQLREILRKVGYTISNQTFQSLVQRYGDLDGKLNFKDFIHCLVRLNNMFDVFEESGLEGTIELNLDQFIQTTMYS